MCFLRENSGAPNDISVFVEDFSVIADGLTNEIFRVSFLELSYWFTISSKDIATLADFETLEN